MKTGSSRKIGWMTCHGIPSSQPQKRSWLNEYWVLIEQVGAMFLRDGVRDTIGRYVLWNTTEVNFFDTLEDSKFKVVYLNGAYSVLLEKGLANGSINEHNKEQVAE
ncbi:hypothetical protein ACJ41O_011812 [Fusarium nematophilum]